jgi:hypothetical protein
MEKRLKAQGSRLKAESSKLKGEKRKSLKLVVDYVDWLNS